MFSWTIEKPDVFDHSEYSGDIYGVVNSYIALGLHLVRDNIVIP